MFGMPMTIPPIAAWNAPAMADFLWTPVWTWPVIATVALELVFVAISCGVLWHFGGPRRLRVRPRPQKRRMHAVARSTTLRKVRPRPRAA